MQDRWKDAAPIYVTFAVARMLAINGATFDGLIGAGFTAGQVDDAPACLGEHVHRTDIGWESRRIWWTDRLRRCLLPRPRRHANPVDICCKRCVTGCSSAPTPDTTYGTTCRAETLCVPTRWRPVEAAP